MTKPAPRIARLAKGNVVALFLDPDLTPQELSASVPWLKQPQVEEALSKRGDYYRVPFKDPTLARKRYNSVYGDNYPMTAPKGATKTVYASLTVGGRLVTENS